MSKFKNLPFMKTSQFSILLLFLIVGFSSCVSNKKIVYLQNTDNKPELAEGALLSYELSEYRLQFNDIIEIQVLTLEDLMKNGFSLSDPARTMQMPMQMGQGGGDIYYMTGYSVDNNGNVRLPVLGDVKVESLTIEGVRELLENELKRYIKQEFFVSVRLGGIRYSAMGEVRKPGKYVVLQDRMTIFEAIANAGDITPIGKRNEVMIIRQYPDGSRVYKINLLDRDIINSPYYFVKPNDQIYVEPLKVRELGAGENAAQTLTLLFSTFTFLVLVLNTLN